MDTIEGRDVAFRNQSVLEPGMDAPRTNESEGVWKTLRTGVREVVEYRELLFQLTLRDVRIRYKQAIMVSDDGRYVIIFNGEIYNYVELREELVDAGYRFRSTGDSEVLLNAYRHWGADCLPRFNGMWAFLVYDRTERSLFGSRDRFGVKPLFVHRDREQILFASEIKSIRASGLYRGGVNWTVASRFLLEGHLDDSVATFYEGISAVPAGSAFQLDSAGTWRTWRYWDLNSLKSSNAEDPAREFADLFEDAVRLRLRADVPVGVCLSGGLDSTSILCAASRQRSESNQSATGPLQAFCYFASEFDESHYIADTLAMTNAALRDLHSDPRELWDSLRQMLWYQDEPVHTMTAAVGYHLMKLVASHGTRVVLNGQGADETIGGYSSYFSDYWGELLSRRRWLQACAEAKAFAEVHGGSPTRYIKDSALRLLAVSLHQNPMYRTFAESRHESGILVDVPGEGLALMLSSVLPDSSKTRRTQGRRSHRPKASLRIANSQTTTRRVRAA